MNAKESSAQRQERFAQQLYRRITWADLDMDWLDRLVAQARDEDLSGLGFKVRPEVSGDATTASVGNLGAGTSTLVARHAIVACGLALVDHILAAYGGNCRFTPAVRDGEKVDEGVVLGTIEGLASEILSAERVLLNFLQRLCGIATQTAQFVAALGSDGPKLLDTRKTTPGLRALEKYATATGGGWNHRLGLYDRIMLKDNHLAATAATAGERLAEAVRRARQQRPDLVVEVEVDEPGQIAPCIEAGADLILFDNFSNQELSEGVQEVAGRALTEASGGITLDRCQGALRRVGVNFVSTGATIHHAPWADIGLDWCE